MGLKRKRPRRNLEKLLEKFKLRSGKSRIAAYFENAVRELKSKDPMTRGRGLEKLLELVERGFIEKGMVASIAEHFMFENDPILKMHGIHAMILLGRGWIEKYLQRIAELSRRAKDSAVKQMAFNALLEIESRSGLKELVKTIRSRGWKIEDILKMRGAIFRASMESYPIFLELLNRRFKGLEQWKQNLTAAALILGKIKVREIERIYAKLKAYRSPKECAYVLRIASLR